MAPADTGTAPSPVTEEDTADTATPGECVYDEVPLGQGVSTAGELVPPLYMGFEMDAITVDGAAHDLAFPDAQSGPSRTSAVFTIRILDSGWGDCRVSYDLTQDAVPAPPPPSRSGLPVYGYWEITPTAGQHWTDCPPIAGEGLPDYAGGYTQDIALYLEQFFWSFGLGAMEPPNGDAAAPNLAQALLDQDPSVWGTAYEPYAYALLFPSGPLGELEEWSPALGFDHQCQDTVPTPRASGATPLPKAVQRLDAYTTAWAYRLAEI